MNAIICWHRRMIINVEARESEGGRDGYDV